jgi:D-alanyl-D-alanine carboxypeptidase
VIEHGSLDSIVHVGSTVPRVPLVKEGLRAGERVPVWKLLYSLLLYSGNDDALALAIHTAGSRPEFIRLMNAEAKRLGLRDTHFNSPSGVLDERNYSSAWDLAVLTRRALRNATFARIVRTRVEHVRWAPPTFAKVYVNKNLLLGSYPGAIGVKTGFTTKAGDCLVAAARRHGRTFVAVLLHDVNRYQDARRLLTLAFAGEAATRGTRR